MVISGSDNVRMDSLLECLTIFTKRYHKAFSANSMIAGLPVKPGEESPELFSINNSKGLFSRAAKQAGLESSLFKRPLKQISPLQLPIILVLASQGACILESFSKDMTKCRVIMPSDDPIVMEVDFEDLEDQYAGFGFMIRKHLESVDEYNKKSLHVEQKHWFWDTVKISKTIYRDVLWASLLINLFVLGAPLFTMNVYDRVVPNNATETLWVFAIGIMLVYIIDAFMKFTRTYLLETAGKKSDIIMSSIIFEKVLNLKLSNIPNSVGALANTIKDFDYIRGFLTNATMALIIDLPFTVIFLAVIFYIGGAIVTIPIITMIMIVGYALYVRKPLIYSIKSTHEANSKKSAHLIETLTNIENLKSLGSLGEAQWKWEETVGEISKKALNSRVLSTSIPTITQLLIQLNSVVIIVFGVYLIQDFELSMGGLIAVVILTSRTLAPMGQVASLITKYEETRAAYDGINDLISQESDRPEGKKFVSHLEYKGKIEFEDVTFTYPNAQIPALKNISFVINPGEKIAIIGKIGSGKSTIAKLILGLYEQDSGQILIDGIDIRQIDPADLRSNISYLSQDVSLFKGTVKDNITFRASHINDHSMIKAARLSGVDDFIKLHPKGYEMAVGERGAGLSGGQRQSIGVARTLLFKTPFILLDEPTNAMDQVTEAKLIKNLKHAISGQTALIVTQKMQILDLVERVIVMNNGKKYLDGPKEEVLKNIGGAK